MDYPQIVTAAIAILSAVIAFISLRRTGETQRQQIRLHKKQEEFTTLQLEMLRKQAEASSSAPISRADLRVELERAGRSFRFAITNWGAGPAHEVNFTIQTREGQMSPLVQGDYDAVFPIDELASGGRASVIAALTNGTGSTFDGQWTWKDSDGTEQRRRSTLTP